MRLLCRRKDTNRDPRTFIYFRKWTSELNVVLLRDYSYRLSSGISWMVFFQFFYSLVFSDIIVTDVSQCQELQVHIFPLRTQDLLNLTLSSANFVCQTVPVILVSLSPACSHDPIVQVCCIFLSPKIVFLPLPSVQPIHVITGHPP